MIFQDIPILDLLPQRPPFVMVDNLMHYDELHTTCRLTVRADNLFCEEGVLSASGLIENVAQTCAARIGYYNKFILKRGIRLGFIGSIRNMDIVRLPRVGEELLTSIEVIEEVFGMTLARAEVKVGEETLVRAEMKIAQSEVESTASAC